ncbi:MAG TPA: hypothetical protein PLQ67_00055 [Burkholderiaceae bacterium]|nr:hypothetical protein [Burkholderiaceae bacterium]
MSEPSKPTRNQTSPPDGNYVELIEQLEKDQLQRLGIRGRPSEDDGVTVNRPASPEDHATPALNHADYRAQVKARFDEAQRKAGRLGWWQLASALVGAALLVGSLSDDGNFLMLVAGVVLMWQPLVRLQRLVNELNKLNGQKKSLPSITDFFRNRNKKP